MLVKKSFFIIRTKQMRMIFQYPMINDVINTLNNSFSQVFSLLYSTLQCLTYYSVLPNLFILLFYFYIIFNIISIFFKFSTLLIYQLINPIKKLRN